MRRRNILGVFVSLSGTKALLPHVQRIIEAQEVMGMGSEAKIKGKGDFLLLMLLLGCHRINLVVACG